MDASRAASTPEQAGLPSHILDPLALRESLKPAGEEVLRREFASCPTMMASQDEVPPGVGSKNRCEWCF